MNCDTCGDNRYELIDKVKKRLVEATNIEDRPEEMAVLDNILFRFWQMGWLNQFHEVNDARICKNVGDNTFVCSECGAHVQITNVGRSYLDENGKRWYSTSNEHKFRYCPNCGAKVVRWKKITI